METGKLLETTHELLSEEFLLPLDLHEVFKILLEKKIKLEHDGWEDLEFHRVNLGDNLYAISGYRKKS